MKHIFELYNYVRERHNIVWTFKGIFLALIKSTNKLPKNVDILFFCHDVHRHVKKNGKMYGRHKRFLKQKKILIKKNIMF